MKNILTVMKKELARVFQDKKLVFTIMIMPGLIIFLVYTFMGKAIEKIAEPEEFYTVYHLNLPADTQTSIVETLQLSNITLEFESISKEQLIEAKEQIENGTYKLLIEFDKDNKYLKYYYNETDIKSSVLYQIVGTVISPETPKVTIDGVEVNIVEEVLFDEKSNNWLAMMLPMLIIIFLFQGALAVGPESIAGDKERGTIATLLATPTKRNHIAMGKVFSLSILAILASLSSFIGIMGSMPALMGFELVEVNYGVTTYLFILVVLVTSVLLITSIISVISAFAKTVKEAASLSAPVMIIGMAVGIMMMFDFSVKSPTVLYMIPIYNTALLLKNAFLGNINMIYLLIGSLTNIFITSLLVVLLTKMFNSEKIMFTK